jgi:hypothetical protein
VEKDSAESIIDWIFSVIDSAGISTVNFLRGDKGEFINRDLQQSCKISDSEVIS